MSATLAQRTKYSYPWMFGRGFDLLFFFAPVFLGVALFCGSQTIPTGTSSIWMVILLNAFGAGPFHQGPTWFFYLDKKHRQYFASDRKKQLIFFAGPPLVMLLSIAGMVFIPALAYLVTMIWAVQHLIQQNVGILLLYHNMGKGEAVVPRPLLSRSLWSPSVFFCSIFAYRFFVAPVLAGLLEKGTLTAQSMQIAQFISLGTITLLGLYATFVVASYLNTLRKLLSEGQLLNVPATAFWAVSIACMVPFGFVGRSFDEAFQIPVTIHWFQYIGLNYMLVKYKYAQSPAENLPSMPPFLLFFTTCLIFLTAGIGLGVIKASGVVGQGSLAFNVIFGVLIGLANVHYFLDAFIWRFRESYQRQEVLPYLLRSRQERA